MYKLVLSIILTIFCFQYANSQGYVQDYKNIGFAVNVTNHHAAVLDNRENQTKYLSYLANMSYGIPISTLFNFNQQVGLGYLQNASTTEKYWTKSAQYAYGLGLSLNVPKFFVRKFSSSVIPYGNVGYKFNYFTETSASRPNKIVSEFVVGGGISYQISPYLAGFAQFNLGQRFGSDFQTSFQTQLGINALVVKLVK